MNKKDFEFRINSLDFTLNIVKRNYEELKEIIEEYEEGNHLHPLKDQDLMTGYHIEFSRRLHNYLNSVYTIIQYSRIIRENLNSDFEDIFQKKFYRIFQDEIYLFYKTLCTYLKHYDNATSIGFTAYSIKDLENPNCNLKHFFSIETEEIFDWEKCPTNLQYYLEENDFKIDVRETIEEFHHDFIRINTWIIENVKDYRDHT